MSLPNALFYSSEPVGFPGFAVAAYIVGESTSLQTAYTFRINRLHHSDHIDPETGIPCDFTQWCEKDLLDMHIRRLGVLLRETAVGSPVYDVEFNWRKNDIEIDFEAISAKDESIIRADFKDVLRC